MKAQQEASVSRSKDAVVAIATLYATLPDAAEYQKAVALIFGNAKKSKAEKDPGLLSKKLDAKCPVTIRSFLSQCRTVAVNWGTPSVREAAEKSGIRAGYDAAKPKAEAESSSKATTAADAKEPTLIEIVAKTVEMGDATKMLKMLESAFVSAKKPIHAKIVHDAAVALVALAS